MIPTWNKCLIAPCICRLLAKSPGREGLVMTDPELMKKTGWRREYLRSVYYRATWDKVAVGDMDLFLWACGLHPSKQRRYKWLLQRAWSNGMEGIRSMKHLRGDQPWRIFQVNSLLRMVERVLEDEQRRAKA